MTEQLLLTGADGFIGRALSSRLAAAGFRVHGVGKELDLFSDKGVTEAVRAQPWDVVVHLAAVTHVPTCEKDPAVAKRVNVGGTAFLLEALRQYRPQARLFFTSTAQVYSPGPHMDEAQAIAPQNAYAQTKWAAEELIRGAASWGLRATILRLFNHTHKSQAPDFFLPHLFAVLKEAPRGKRIQVPVGNLDIDRDVGALSDLLAALVAVIQRPKWEGIDVLNICSGRAKRLRDLAQLLAKAMEVDAEFVVDPARVRAGEPLSVCGAHDKLSRITGWHPKVTTAEELIQSFLA